MIIIKVQGGLGNQMFQYALYRRMQEDGRNVKMDIAAYETYSLHNGYELEKIFNLKINYANEFESFSLIDKSYISELEENKILNFQKEIMQLDDCYLSGYWQNEKYFKEIREIILNDFKFNICDENNIKLLEKVKSTESVSIHVRRGDYLAHSDLNNIATKDYYKNAINIINEKVSNPEFFIFSDDIKWARDNLNIKNGVFVDCNNGADSYKDMLLMSNCKHNIIANSTFSWWGAWLNKNKNKIVIRPKVWMNSANKDDEICMCNTWIRCSNGEDDENYNKKTVDNKIKQYSHSYYIDLEKYEVLSNIFCEKKYEILEKLQSKRHKYIYYFNFRVSIIENNKNKVEENFSKFIDLIDNNIDLNLVISAKFHLGEYKYACKEYEEASRIFLDINELTKGNHSKAKYYLRKLASL